MRLEVVEVFVEEFGGSGDGGRVFTADDGGDGGLDLIFLVVGFAGGFFEGGEHLEPLAVEGEALAGELDFLPFKLVRAQATQPTGGTMHVFPGEGRSGGSLKGVKGHGSDGGVFDSGGVLSGNWGGARPPGLLPQSGEIGRAGRNGGGR